MSDFILQNQILTKDGKWKDIGDAMPADGEYALHWIHLYRESLSTQKWLYENDFDDPVIESLTDEDTRPRTSAFPDGVLINLRTVNTNRDEQPYDMLSMRMFIQKNKIISTSLKEIHII